MNNNPETSINQAKSQFYFPFALSEQPIPVKPKKKRNYTREEQYEHGEERKRSYAERRWGPSKKRREELNTLYPSSNLFNIPIDVILTTSNEALARKKNINIYISENLEYGIRNAKAFATTSWIDIQALRDPFQSFSPPSFFKNHSLPLPSTLPLQKSETERTGRLEKKEEKEKQ